MTAHDLRPTARATETAIAATFDAFDGRRDPTLALADAMQACDEARAEVAARAAAIEAFREAAGPLDEALGKARGWLAVAADRLARAPFVPREARPLAASHAAPALQRLDRASLSPAFRVKAPIDRPLAPSPDALAALPPDERLAQLAARADARRRVLRERAEARERARNERQLARARRGTDEGPAGYVRGGLVAQPAASVRQTRARTLLEQIAALGGMRTPQLGDRWQASEVLDRRLLTATDAFHALGRDAWDALEVFALDAPAKDPGRVFAAAFVAGALEGRDALGFADRVFRHVGTQDPEARAMLGSALRLAPNPSVVALLRAYLDDPDEGVRAVGIDVLGARRWASLDELARAAIDGSDCVVASALEHAATARIPELATALDRAASSPDPDVARARAWAIAIGGLPSPALVLAREPSESALVPLALVADRDDALALVARLDANPTKALATACGFAGPPEAIGALVRVLRSRDADGDTKLAAAFALDRLTGARLLEEAELPPERLDAPEPDVRPGVREPELARTLSRPNDLPSDGSPDTLPLPTRDPGRWAEHLAEHPELVEGEARKRRGERYTPELTWRELAHDAATPVERRILYRELVVKTGEALPFDTNDFVPVQAAALEAWWPLARKASSQSGMYGRMGRR